MLKLINIIISWFISLLSTANRPIIEKVDGDKIEYKLKYDFEPSLSIYVIKWIIIFIKMWWNKNWIRRSLLFLYFCIVVSHNFTYILKSKIKNYFAVCQISKSIPKIKLNGMLDEYTTTSMFTSRTTSRKYFWWSLLHKWLFLTDKCTPSFQFCRLHANKVI